VRGPREWLWHWGPFVVLAVITALIAAWLYRP
jgi:hypothetical protein